MIRNRYNRIPHPALNTKRERDTYNTDGTKIKTAQVKSQGDIFYPTDGHEAILNKLNSKLKTNRIRANIDNLNKPQQEYRLETVSNKLLGGGAEGRGTGGGLKLGLRCSNLTLMLSVMHETQTLNDNDNKDKTF